LISTNITLHCPLGTSKDILKSTTEETFKLLIKKLKISAQGVSLFVLELSSLKKHMEA